MPRFGPPLLLLALSCGTLQSPVVVGPGANGGGAGGGGGAAATSYAQAQAELAARRIPGPSTTQGSTGQCAGELFFWRDGNGKLHSWNGRTRARLDYGFTVPLQRFFRPSERLVPVSVAPTYQRIEVYDAAQANALVASLPAVADFVGTDEGVLKLSLRGAFPNEQTQVQLWQRADGGTIDLSAPLPTNQPAAAYDEGLLVIPSDSVIPFAYWLVPVGGAGATSVTFDGAISARAAVPSSAGLLVEYARSGGATAIRLYRGNKDTREARFEVGDELSNLPRLYPDAPVDEHLPLTRLAAAGDELYFGGFHGVFGYRLRTGALRALQLAPIPDESFIVDVLCVLEGPRLLLYRALSDPLGQVWAVPLD